MKFTEPARPPRAGASYERAPSSRSLRTSVWAAIRVSALFTSLVLFAACDLLSPDRPEFDARVSGAVEMTITGVGGFVVQRAGENASDGGWYISGSSSDRFPVALPLVTIGHRGGAHAGRLSVGPYARANDDPASSATAHFSYMSPGGMVELFKADSGYVEVTSFTEERAAGHFRIWATYVGASEEPRLADRVHGPAPDGDQVVIRGRFDVPPMRGFQTLGGDE